MIQVFPAESRYSAEHGWLHSKFSFSFAEYFDPNNLQFGPMRVLNDDRVAAHRGFGTHPHKEMEIVSIVLEGYLKHEDSYGHGATTTFGEIQRMSAGTGIFHSEINPADEEVNFLQMWFLPKELGTKPSYEKSSFTIEKMKNALLPVVSYHADKLEEAAFINQDLTIYLSDLEPNQSISFSQKNDRKTFVFVIEGKVKVGDEWLMKRDSARIENEEELVFITEGKSRFMVIDLPNK
ncbi:pirin family protein [Ectobacillus sp. sgz5001026]|uniref:pirin family protein n=1 Tax=Ectobacillus sp. sgz5001026 TaxID=3242473 RepID=UPI0036D3982C